MKNLLSLHHIGYVVKDIKATAAFYEKSGWNLSEIIIEPIQNCNIAFLSKDKFPLIELVAPIDESSPVFQTLKRSGVSLYHICYEVDNIDEAVEQLWLDEHFIPLFEPITSNVMDDRKICYLYNKDVGLIELVNSKE